MLFSLEGSLAIFVFVEKKKHCVVCVCLYQYGLERILGEEKSLTLLARAIDPTQSAMMTDVVKLLSAICIVGEENTYVPASLIFVNMSRRSSHVIDVKNSDCNSIWYNCQARGIEQQKLLNC